MKFVFTADKDALGKRIKAAQERIAKAKDLAVQDAAHEMVQEGRANIASAGFSSKWQEGLVAKFRPTEKGGDPSAVVFHRNNLAAVFERGVTIHGKPLLWLPIKANTGGIKSPKKYRRKLVSVNVAGKPPLLFDAQDRKRGPLFVGVQSVTIRKRWQLKEIFARVAARLGEFFKNRMASGK